MVVLYGLLVLTGFAVRFVFEAVRGRAGPPAAAPAGLMLVPLLFLFASAGSATADRYLPDERLDHTGFFSWIAHRQPAIDGQCPRFGLMHELCR
jgi:galactan 5-O-arabinofuranosyltransferase